MSRALSFVALLLLATHAVPLVSAHDEQWTHVMRTDRFLEAPAPTDYNGGHAQPCARALTCLTCFGKETAMAPDAEATLVQARVPARLLAEAQTLVEGGWFASVDQLMLDALRRFLESHPAEMMEQFVREDIEWGLHGKD